MNNNTTYLIIGDINIDIRPEFIDATKEKYLDCLLSFGFTSCINQPTRVASDTCTCIDHCFTNHFDADAVTACILTTELTDHYTIACKIEYGVKNVETPDRQLTYLDRTELNRLIWDQAWVEVIEQEDVDIAAEIFINKITECRLKATRLKKSNTRFRKIKPWITKELIKAIRTRDKLSKLAKKCPFNPDVLQNYKVFRNQLNNSIKNARLKYFKTKILDSRGNPKLFWNTVNEITGLNKPKNCFAIKHFIHKTSDFSPQDIKSIANDFNSHFAGVGSGLARAIPPAGPAVIVDANYMTECALQLRPASEEEVFSCVRDLRGGSAPGVDGIVASVLKDNYEVLVRPLHHIVNLSLKKGIFPKIFKTAKVTPLYKSNIITDYNNYRPISLLSVCAKIIEKCIKIQLQSYLESYSLIFGA